MDRTRKAIGFTASLLFAGALSAAAGTSAQAGCSLQTSNNQIKRVIHISFDNVHLRRDNPNVPSDLEQMPNLLNFVLNNGTISGNHHTPLISHTATDILTALTGVYGDRMGMPVSNSYGFFKSNGSVGFSSSFLYWTSPSNGTIAAGDGLPNMLGQDGKTHPAPWVPFTRAGCDVGAFSVANIEFENATDVAVAFGASSTQAQNVTNVLAANPNDNVYAHQQARQALSTDWLGIAVHCAQNSPICSGPHAAPDLLPDEPGGYSNFNALFGNINVAPVLCPSGTTNAACHGAGNVKDINGTVIRDGFGRPGFPNGFSPTAARSLGYAAAMLEKGIPLVYLYIADAHDRNPLAIDPVTGRAAPNRAFGPGEQEYVNQLKAYDDAFGKFFSRLASNGITKDNTLFVIVPDENDHFVGSQPTPAGCDGINIPCNYTYASEINAVLNRLLISQRSNATPFSVHSDDAPTVYINGNPAPTDPVTRTMEHDLDLLTAVNPITGKTDKLSAFLADRAEMKLLHMVTASPARTPSLTMFGDPDYYFFNSSPPTPPCSQAPACVYVTQPPAGTYAYNHGDVQSDITTTWLAMVGPGVKRQGRNDEVFSDHTDVRPTMLALLGLKDSYIHDGRVLAEKLDERALPAGIRRNGRENFIKVARAFKQLNAPLGSVGRDSLVFANRSIVGNDGVYNNYLTTLGNVTSARDALAGQMKTALDAAAFGNTPLNERQQDRLVDQARNLIDRVADLAGDERRRRADRD